MPIWNFTATRLLFLKGGWRVPHLEVYGKRFRNQLKMLQIELSTDAFVFTSLQIAFRDPRLISFHVNICMSVVQAGFFCHSFCLRRCLSLLNWEKEWKNCTFRLIKHPFQDQTIQLVEISITWNHMCMNLRKSWQSQVLDPIRKWQLLKLLQLNYLWLCQGAS